MQSNYNLNRIKYGVLCINCTQYLVLYEYKTTAKDILFLILNVEVCSV